MSQTVTLEVFYPHCQERVWQALTDRRALAGWMMDNNFEPRLGHKFHFRQTDGFGLDRCIHCEVIELEPPNRLAYCWQEAQTEDSMIVTWTLTPVSGGTTLQLRHLQLVQTTAISPSVMLQRSRGMSNAMSYGRDYESPINTLMLGLLDNSLEGLQFNGSSTRVIEHSLIAHVEWNSRLIKLTQVLTPNDISDQITESLETEGYPHTD